MKEVAEHLGLSRTTVSLVLQGRGDEYRISRETQQMVLDYVKKTSYKPNYFAKALNRGRSDIIGAVFPDVFESFMNNIIRGIESVLYERGYSLMISTSRFDNKRECSVIEKMVWQGVDGIILIPTMPFHGETPYDGSHIESLLRQGYPFVVVDRVIEGLETHTVLQNDRKAARNAVSKAISQGARNVCCVSLALAASSIDARLAGYREAVQAEGMEETVISLFSLNPESDDLEKQTEEVMRSASPADTFFVTTSGLADKLSWILRTYHFDARIIRFGETPRWVEASMEDIPHPHKEMGEAASKLLLDVIRQPDLPPQHIVCEAG
jgi:DNA-binding LacI/PurR family transcriptional regulator